MKLYHRTSLATAMKILRSGQIWSKDGAAQQANFSPLPDANGNQLDAGRSEITLIFEWIGHTEDLDQDIKPLTSCKPNVLYRIQWELCKDPYQIGRYPDRAIWTCATVSGTDHGLRAIGIYEDQEECPWGELLFDDSDPRAALLEEVQYTDILYPHYCYPLPI